MAMESVKMGRIPKKVKEKALKNYQKYQERKSHQPQQQQQQQSSQEHLEFIVENDDFIDSEIDNSSLSSFIRESTSSSSSDNSSMNTQPPIDFHQDIVIIPPSK